MRRGALVSAVAGGKQRAFHGSPLRCPRQPEMRSDRRRCSQPLCSVGSWTLGGVWAGSPWSPSPPDHSCCSPMRTPSKGKSQVNGEKSNKWGIINGTPKKRQDSSGFITTVETWKWHSSILQRSRKTALETGSSYAQWCIAASHRAVISG